MNKSIVKQNVYMALLRWHIKKNLEGMNCMWMGNFRCIYFKLNYVPSRFYCPIKILFNPEADDALTGGE